MTGFRGADPVGLGRLGGEVEGAAAVLAASAQQAFAVLAGRGRGALADRVGPQLAAVGRRLGADAVDLIRRAELIRQAEQLSGLSAVPAVVASEARLAGIFAIEAPMGLADWDASYRSWRRGPPIDQLVDLDAAAVADAFAGMSPTARNRLVLSAPEIIGGLDGAPPELRYTANRILMHREVGALTSAIEWIEDELAANVAEVGDPFLVEAHREAARANIEQLHETIARYRMWLEEGRQILLFDPSGDGRVAEVFGELSGADHVAVVVPGITNDITNFGPPGGGGFRTDAQQLFGAASRLDGSVATIAWLGYDTPDGADAVLRSAADAGYADLVAFVEGLVAAGDRHITVVGHSYGSLVTGMAAGEGIAADEVVFVGSPGTSLDHAGDANLPPGGEVWAGLASWDLIGAGISPTPDDLWEASLSIAGRYIWDALASGDLAVEDLWHGTNPAHESFGAVEFTTDGATGHGQYFDPGTDSLDNLARIVAGLAARVEVVASQAEELAPGPFDGEWDSADIGGEVV